MSFTRQENANPNVEKPVAVAVPLTDAQKKRMEKAIPKLEELQLKMATAIVNAEGAEMSAAQVVSPKLLLLAKASQKKFDDKISEAHKVFLNNLQNKGQFKQLFEDIKKYTEEALMFTKRLDHAMELASEDKAEAE